MHPSRLETIFLDAAGEVLESMFFTCVGSCGALQADEELLSAELSFDGRAAGRFGIRLPLQSGRIIAANFLGMEAVSDAQAAEVICELTNMLCGSVLSRIEENARFELRHPQVDPENTDWRIREHAIGYTFGTGEGTLTMWIAFSQPDIARPAA